MSHVYNLLQLHRIKNKKPKIKRTRGGKIKQSDPGWMGWVVASMKTRWILGMAGRIGSSTSSLGASRKGWSDRMDPDWAASTRWSWFRDLCRGGGDLKITSLSSWVFWAHGGASLGPPVSTLLCTLSLIEVYDYLHRRWEGMKVEVLMIDDSGDGPCLSLRGSVGRCLMAMIW